MIAPRSEIPRLQSDFYRDQFRKILRWLFTSLFIILLLIAVVIYLILFHPRQQYYANTIDGKIMRMPTPYYGTTAT